MWLITNFGFFSIVQKPDDQASGTLTIRSRAKSDLEFLQAKYLPNMGPILANAGSDYKYRAKASREALAVAMLRITMDLDYANFKSAVATTQGHQRAAVYHQVWDVLYALQDQEPTSSSKAQPAAAIAHQKYRSYGGVVLNTDGQVLLRKPAGEFDGYVWTFPKGRLESGMTPEATALKEVLEETGYHAEIVTVVPGSFVGGTSVTEYFLMAPVGEAGSFDVAETQEVCWVSPDQAVEHIKLTRNVVGRDRDLAVLAAALSIKKAQS